MDRPVQAGGATTHTPRDLLAAMRPSQWTKNIVVLAALVFAFFDRAQNLDLTLSLARAVPAMLLFCLASSGIYILNDVRDIAADRAHPTKRYRPIAAGRLAPAFAGTIAVILLTLALVGALLLQAAFAGILTAYVAIQLVYSYGLKRLALIDIFVIATGFVLRAIAGAIVLDVVISPWLLLCTFLLALFLALCKRRHEKLLIEDLGGESRASLEQYDKRLLDLLIAITAAATLVAYAIYTLTPETVLKFGTHKLGFTIPFVIFGVFRYLDLVYRHEKGDRPEKILLTDAPTLVNIALYGITLLGILIGR